MKRRVKFGKAKDVTGSNKEGQEYTYIRVQTVSYEKNGSDFIKRDAFYHKDMKNVETKTRLWLEVDGQEPQVVESFVIFKRESKDPTKNYGGPTEYDVNVTLGE